MIHEIDDAIRAFLRAEALPGTEVDIVFDAPNTEWASRRTGPAINIYLYDVRETLERRTVGERRTMAPDGTVVSTTKPPRFYRLSYLVTAWTQRPEDEHRLLSAVLACLIQDDWLPEQYLPEILAEIREPIELTIAYPPPDERSVSEVWTALGGELKPSLDVAITVPFIPGRIMPAAPPVREVPKIGLAGAGGQQEEVGGHADRSRLRVQPAEQVEEAADVVEEAQAAPDKGRAGKMVRTFSHAAGTPEAGTGAPESPPSDPEETIRGGATDAGRVIKVRHLE